MVGHAGFGFEKVGGCAFGTGHVKTSGRGFGGCCGEAVHGAEGGSGRSHCESNGNLLELKSRKRVYRLEFFKDKKIIVDEREL